MMLKNFPSRYGRKALIATYLVKNSPQLTLGTFHLESYPEEHPARKLQLEMIKSLTRYTLLGIPFRPPLLSFDLIDRFWASDCSHVIFCGDTNFVLDSEADVLLGDRFNDSWQQLYHSTPEDKAKNPGYTFDSETNIMSFEANKFKAKTRIDRLVSCCWLLQRRMLSTLQSVLFWSLIPFLLFFLGCSTRVIQSSQSPCVLLEQSRLTRRETFGLLTTLE